MADTNPNQLIVEARDDLGAIVGLMQHHLDWPDNNRPVHIECARSAEELLNQAFLSASLKRTGLRALGVVIDADDKLDGRWNRLRNFLSSRFGDLPQTLPTGGLIVEQAGGVRFGAWFMPDNNQGGMLEDFCALLVPEAHAKSWHYAAGTIEEARKQGGQWRDVHRSKAQIHTWLAWQDPPGERLGIALTKKILEPTSRNAEPFVLWFKRLYGF